MKKVIILTMLILCGLGFCINKANALINIDDESVKIAIKYGLDNKYSTTKELLGPNWIEGEDGVIITIFSPFIQLATKAKSQNVPGSSDEDIVLVKRRLGRQLNEIKTRQEIRVIVQLIGNNADFCKKYEAYIEEAVDADDKKTDDTKTANTKTDDIKTDKDKGDKGKDKGKSFWIFKNKGDKVKKPKKITPSAFVKQEKAELDHYNPYMPYSGTNSYNFSFEKVNQLDKFNFVIVGPDEKEIKFLVDKNAIF